MGKAVISIRYCTQCNWMLRSCWMAQEILHTFNDSIAELSLIPGTDGVFEIKVNDQTIWERKADSGFPDVKTLKQRIRDVIDPERDLGHVDRKKT